LTLPTPRNVLIKSVLTAENANNAKVYDILKLFAKLGVLCVFAVSDFFSGLLEV